MARCLACAYLTGGREEADPAGAVPPGLQLRRVCRGHQGPLGGALAGRQEVTYPVEDGLLCAFAEVARSSRRSRTSCSVDEINRGNLPRLFGELLYLLEYREQCVRLPYSRRDFQLPRNLYLIGTMNAADRSVVHLDQALRRRFSMVEMRPDSRVLVDLAGRP